MYLCPATQTQTMDFNKIQTKLEILAEAAKYDVSCSSSGSQRSAKKNSVGNTHRWGICHSFTEDGRCVSLLKILLTNHCIFDCAYCVSRRSNNVRRAAFTVEEVVQLTMNFYKRNYIEGLFLSSGIFKDANTTMERLVRIAKKLRQEHQFNGYIHLKSIPGASPELMQEAGLYADRLSVNLEIPTEEGLKRLAPEKSHKELVKPMRTIKNALQVYQSEKKIFKNTPTFSPAGQTTQMIVGATDETDLKIIHVADYFYKKYQMRRVYYSGYVPMVADARLPAIDTQIPEQREHRLYQADWLMRFYGFDAQEILDPTAPFLDLELDPKLAWAIRHRHLFPVDINSAPREMLLRIPGVGVKSVERILSARRFQRLGLEHLRRMGVATNRARYFMEYAGGNPYLRFIDQQDFRQLIINASQSAWKPYQLVQPSLF